jgi:hypothetical protein
LISHVLRNWCNGHRHQRHRFRDNCEFYTIAAPCTFGNRPRTGWVIGLVASALLLVQICQFANGTLSTIVTEESASLADAVDVGFLLTSAVFVFLM